MPWVKDQFRSKLAIEPFPGTLNLEISDPDDLRAFASLKEEQGVEITPEQECFCSAKCYPALIAGTIRAAIVYPCVGSYPDNKMELIAPVHVRKTLGAREGDLIEVEILREERG